MKDDDDFTITTEASPGKLVMPVDTSLREVTQRAIDFLMEDKDPSLEIQVMDRGMIYNMTVTTTSIHPPVALREDPLEEFVLTKFGSRLQ